ncbi:MAG: DUF721 domain-containing protein [Verrucomicrobiota bacterium]
MADSKKQPHTFSRLAEELIGDLRGIPFDEPRRQVKRATKPLTELVEELLNKFQVGRDAPEHTIRAEWPAIVGPANANYSHPVQIDARGQLLVLVNHSVVKNELFRHRATILERIQALPACAGVKKLHFRAG